MRVTVLIPLRIRSISTIIQRFFNRDGSPKCLNPFENQVYFHARNLPKPSACSQMSVLIPLRIRSISTFSKMFLHGNQIAS